MAENSLFAILLRSPWWISLLIAGAVALLARLLLPERFVVPGMLGATPFVVLAALAARKQWHAPSANQVERLLQRLSAMGARDFSAVVEAAFRSQGHEVQRFNGPGADLELRKAGRCTLVSLRRWKAANLGVEPLRELQAAQQRHGADAGLCIAGGSISDKARAYAKAETIRLMDAAELAQLLHSTGALPNA